jgi:hypothetical protein
LLIELVAAHFGTAIEDQSEISNQQSEISAVTVILTAVE